MKYFKTAFHLLKFNLKSIILFEVIYKLFAWAVFSPVLYRLLDLAMRLSGSTYLTNDNMKQFFLTPTTDLVMLLIFLLMSFYTLIDMSAMIFCFQESYFNRKTHVLDMLRNGVRSAGKIFRFRTNWLMLVFLLLVIPMTNISLISGYVSSVRLPGFVMDYINQRLWLIIVYTVGMLLLCWLCMKWLFSIHYYTLEDCTFLEGRQKSMSLIQGRKWKNLAILILWNAGMTAIFYGVLLLGSPVISWVTQLAQHSELVYAVALSTVTDLFWIIAILYYCFSVPITFAIISALYYNDKLDKKEAIVDWMPKTELPDTIPILTKLLQRKKLLTLLVIVALVLGNLNNCLPVARGKSTYGDNATVEITAHRGDSTHYPENTMPAFESAVELGADAIELDIQQTRDGVIMVMHDSNLKRVTGLNRDIWDVDYEDIQDLDVGSWFDPKFKSVRFSTLEEVMEEMRGRVQLHIEMKPTGYEKNFEKNLAELIDRMDYRDQCIVTSRNLPALQKLESYDASIRTAYVAVTAYGHIEDVGTDDVYIEENNIGMKMTENVHKAGKRMIAWVVNTQENMEQMLDYGVDSIVTDDPELLMSVLHSRKQKGYLHQYFNDLFSIFQVNDYWQLPNFGLLLR